MATAPYNQSVSNIDMVGSDRVTPPAIQYGNLNPEAINCDIRLIKFTPVSTITQARGNDVIRFLMSNDGYFDPYSAYLKIQVDVPFDTVNTPDEIRFLDRSAHSFIQRMVIRSNGVEIERIENYDVAAAMINDTMYSPEQMKQHHWEGFPSIDTAVPIGFTAGTATTTATTFQNMSTYNSMLCPGAANLESIVGEPAFFPDMTTDPVILAASALDNINQIQIKPISTLLYTSNGGGNYRGNAERTVGTNQDYIYHLGRKDGKANLPVIGTGTAATTLGYKLSANTSREFIIPLMSGFMGVMQPQKKFIPLSFIPLDIEFTINPYALYSSHAAAEGGTRNFVISRMEIISHVLFFDAAVNSQLETSISQYGLYLHCNSFQLAPVTTTTNGSNTVPGTVQIGMTHKSINSVHLLFYYQNYESAPQARKLHFVSHNVKKMQLRNGATYVPSEPMTATNYNYGSGDTFNYSHVQFLVEMYKAWGKMHDPSMDSLITAYNWGSDILGIQKLSIMTLPLLRLSTTGTINDVLREMYAKQSLIGRTQYAISLEGEELGESKTLISGRSAKTPFDLSIQAVKAEQDGSYINVFIRYDFIVQIRSDLLIQVSGR